MDFVVGDGAGGLDLAGRVAHVDVHVGHGSGPGNHQAGLGEDGDVGDARQRSWGGILCGDVGVLLRFGVVVGVDGDVNAGIAAEVVVFVLADFRIADVDRGDGFGQQ
jgi:hypothetical protein